MAKKMIYTVLVQLIGYVALIYRCKDFPKRMRFYKDPDTAWIHIHNNAARYIISNISKTYTITGWHMTDRNFVYSADIRLSTPGFLNASLVLRRYNKPDTKRPYYALLGERMVLIRFLSNMVDEITSK